MFCKQSTSLSVESSNNGDWSAARIAYELKCRGLSFRQLAIRSGYAPSSLWNVTRVSWPKGERLVARALGLAVADIWPSRIKARRARKKGRGAVKQCAQT